MLGFTSDSVLDFSGLPGSRQADGANAGLAIQFGSTGQEKFQPSPLDPSWVLEGNPTARGLTLAKAQDGQFSCGLWDCTAGKFKFIYFCDEMVHILEGEVIVDDGTGPRTLRAGDVAYFPEGLTTLWTVPTYVRKYCIHRSVKRSLVSRLWSKAAKICLAMVRAKPIARSNPS